MYTSSEKERGRDERKGGREGWREGGKFRIFLTRSQI